MSTPALTVGRLTATVRLDGPDDGSGRRVDAILREVAGTQLPRAWSGVDLPPGHWCLRRLRVAMEIEPGHGDLVLSEQWARALVSSIGVAVRQGSAEVVHYRHRLDALADAVAQLAVGRPDRAWAWAQVGVLAPGDRVPAATPAAAVLAVLLGSPELIVPALVTAARRCGMAALDRAVGAEGWRLLAERLWGTPVGRPLAAGPTSVHPTPAGPPPAVLAASELATAIGRSRLAPADPVLDAWAVLVALELDPVLARRPLAAQQLGRVRAALGAASPGRRALSPAAPSRRRPATDPEPPPAGPTASPAPGPASPATAPGTPAAAAPGTPAAAAPGTPAGAAAAAPSPASAGQAPPAGALSGGPSPRSATGQPDAAAVAPADPGPTRGPDGEPPEGRRTDWAGLPFLLATAAAVGLPDRLLDARALAARPLAWCLHAVGQAITGAPRGDPGLLALAGLHGARGAAVAAAPPPGDAEQAVLDQVARDWAAVTAARLAAASTDPAANGHWTGADPGEVVVGLVRRPGRVVAEPGWIEVHLPLDGVDVVVRRAGLDADPGWVDWLGTVVRFVYA